MNKQSQTIQHTEVGNVVSDRMNKTITVRIERRIRHPLYHKYVVRHKKLHVHDEENSAAIGDVVRIAPCRPLARTKSWRLVEIIRRHDVGVAQ